MVELTPEMKEQLEKQKQQCVFCKIISGEMESKKVYEDEFIIAILDINPAARGHMLVMPKEHYPILPYMPTETFKHMFGLMPRLVDAVKQSFLVTGANIFIANGAVAGQQSAHFLVHLLPRDTEDNLTNFDFSGNGIDEHKQEDTLEILKKNIPVMLSNHFNRNPEAWHNGQIKRADFLDSRDIVREVVYEDEKAVVVVPENPLCAGHLQVYSQEKQENFHELDKSSAYHLFYVASFSATALFEGMRAQGTNIILKTGLTKDNMSGEFSIHILPRFSEDKLDILWTALEEKPDADIVLEKLRENMILVENKDSTEEERKVIVDDGPKELDEVNAEKTSHQDQIFEAIEKVR